MMLDSLTLEAMEQLGRRIADIAQPGDAIGLTGGLGAGKTTLSRAMLSGLGLQGEAPSPSFAIVQPYAPPDVCLPVLHVDLYRLGHPDEAAELGLDEARSDHLLIIEWPEKLGAGVWPDMLMLHIDDSATARRLTAAVPPAWEGRWPPNP